MSNPFANWTPGDVERHNERINQQPVIGKVVQLTNPNDLSILKDSVPLHDKVRLEVCSTTDEVKLNKMERRYWEVLKRENHLWVGAQCLSLKLGDDCRYNPDFIMITQDGKIEVHETKGFMRPGARVKLKTAARTFTWIKFVIVRLTKGVFEKEVVKA